MEIDLLSSLKNGNRLAMEEIYHTYWEQVFDAAFKRLGDDTIAQDITQEIFISLWENRNNIIINTTLGAYFHGAVKYKVINYFKSSDLRTVHQEAFGLLMHEQVTDATDTKLILEDLNKELDAALSRLPEKMRLIISMSRKQEKSIKEIASELGVSVQTVKNQITAGMKILRKDLSFLLFVALFLS
ncbi:RNA polymerase sigma-70 factor [Pedobacter antarcticus]|uniref:RNA polymerase sigma-70 factor n=1 Tax=Pedobacter antarcticus TaxID=34086 RepID=UPI001C57B172|nr:RNA polymerase sigma-70 factor [Pedobacter antarcticus]